jgi:phosphate transport system permease protein
LATPIITVVTDRAIKNLDQNIINASYAMGSSKMQTLFNHIIPMATPSIITGTIIAISRVVGETAPLLMIGMVAYITLPPTNIFSPSTTIPIQIYTWANNPNPLFAEKASVAILILLVLLALFNIIANIIRKKYDLHSL